MGWIPIRQWENAWRDTIEIIGGWAEPLVARVVNALLDLESFTGHSFK
jgi:hypothetical protein